MKKIILTIALIATTISFSQSLESKIPANTKVVVTVDGSRLLELMPLTEFENYAVIKEIIKDVQQDKPHINGISDLGFDINSDAYYFYYPTDSITYHVGLIKLKNRADFEKLLDESDQKKIVREGNVSHYSEDSELNMMWNDNILILSGGMLSYSYFDKNRERFEAQALNEDESFYEVKKRVAGTWAANYAKQLFNYKGASIQSNQNYQKSKDINASVTLWISNYGGMMNDMMNSSLYYTMGSRMNVKNNRLGFGSMVAQLYFEEDKARMTSKLEINENWQKTFKKIYASKLDKSFFKYFNENDVLSYASFSMNTEAFLDEYPRLMSEIYGGMLPEYEEETSVAADLFSLILDEEAVGELVTGDMLFVLNDIVEKDITYTTYEYDDDYNETEVKKTKKEASPDFTIMVGSENEKLLFRLIRLGVKHEAFETKKNYYKLNLPSKTPFDLFAVIKDEKIFLTTSEKRLTDIISNRVVSKSDAHKKRIRKNSSVLYVDLDNLIAKIPESELSSSEKEFAKYAEGNLKEAYFTGKMKGNILYSELIIETEKNRKNSLKVLLDFLEFVD